MGIECKPSAGKSKLSPKIYDLVIIGGGPAGMGAAIYASRYKINCVIVSPALGGIIADAHTIENWLGENSISGMDLVKKFAGHVKAQKVPIIEECTTKITQNQANPGLYNVYTDTKILRTKFVLISSGLMRRKLNVPGEKEFSGKGISYCATCDAPLFRGFNAAVIGGGDSAASAAILAAKYAKQVYIIYRKDKLKAEPYWQDMIKRTKNIKVMYNTNVTEFLGDKMLKGAKLDNGKELKLDGVIVEVGSVPTDMLIKDLKVKTDDKGYIMVDQTMQTNIKGIYAAGDVNNASNNFKQIATAFGESAVAANAVFMNLHKNKYS